RTALRRRHRTSGTPPGPARTSGLDADLAHAGRLAVEEDFDVVLAFGYVAGVIEVELGGGRPAVRHLLLGLGHDAPEMRELGADGRGPRPVGEHGHVDGVARLERRA